MAGGTLSYILDRYNHRSGWALLCLLALYLTMFISYHHMLDWSAGMDWLLAGIWLFMSAVLIWDIVPARDLRLVVVGFFGGLIIEWWGTTTSLWSYYTDERPPIWILPAWPVAALTIERIALVVERLLPPANGKSANGKSASAWITVGWLLIPAFILLMVAFLWPTIPILSSQVVVALMAGVLLTTTDMRRDLSLFIAGSLLGIFLEYWGTSRFCWTYYTREVPPIEAVLAHGFASVAFSRGAAALSWLGTLVGAGRSGQLSERSPVPNG